MGIGYTEHKFKNLGQAKKMQKLMKKNYGYRPSIFEWVTGKKVKYIVVKPKGLIKVR